MSPLERDALAERIAEVLLARKKFNDERRTRAGDFQTYYNERTFRRPDMPQIAPADLLAGDAKPRRSPLFIRWNSPNG